MTVVTPEAAPAPKRDDAYNPSGYVLDEQVGYLLRLVSQRHATIFQKHSLEGITPTQFSAMVRILEQGECSQNQLGRLAAMDVATIKGVADRLHQKGLIASRPDPNDKRRTLLRLTRSGLHLVEKMIEAGFQISTDTLEPLSESERTALLKLLKKMS